MKARCKCGRIFVVRPELEGKKVRCPGCGKVVQLPSSAPPAAPPPKETPKAAPPSPEWEEAFPQEAEPEAGPPGKPSGRKPAVEPDTEAPTRDEEPTEAPKKAEPEFDWSEGFSLEAEEAAAQKPQPSPPAARQEGPARAAAPKEETGLAFDSQEFHIDTGGPEKAEEAPVDLGAGQILGIREEAVPAAPAAQKTQICSQCGRVFTEKVDFCPECGKALGAPAAPKAAERAPAWAGSFWGAFGYAYAAVFAVNGWRSWLRYLLVGAGAPVLLVLFMKVPYCGCFGCFALPIVLVVTVSAVVGAMYFYMAHAAASGLQAIQEARPRVWDDMVVPLYLVICSSNLLVAGPIIAGFLVARLTGSVDFAELRNLSQVAEGVGGFAKIGGVMASSALILAGMAIGVFCFPMQLMLLGASQSLWKTANPVNMLKALFKAPLDYLMLCVFFMLNLVLTPILVLLATFGPMVVGVGFLGGMLVFAAIVGIVIYMASVNGWRMGMFLYSNPKVFDHVR